MLIDPNTHQFSDPRGFIVFEGVNGVGKTTLLKSLSSQLQKCGRKVLETMEPGGSPVGKRIREIVIGSAVGEVSPLSELLLFAADRAQHVAKVIEPALGRGEIVLSDRFLYSTTAFQGYGRELDKEMVAQINQIAVQGLYPDLVILLDLDPEEGLRRTASRKETAPDQSQDSMEEEELAFHRRLRDGFLKLSQECAEPFHVVDATLSPEQILAECTPLVEALEKALR